MTYRTHSRFFPLRSGWFMPHLLSLTFPGLSTQYGLYTLGHTSLFFPLRQDDLCHFGFHSRFPGSLARSVLFGLVMFMALWIQFNLPSLITSVTLDSCTVFWLISAVTLVHTLLYPMIRLGMTYVTLDSLTFSSRISSMMTDYVTFEYFWLLL